MRAGAFDFIGKPVALRRLQEALACFETPAKAPRKPKVDEDGSERRRAPRAMLSLPVQIREQSGDVWESTSVNLSASGIKVRANWRAPTPAGVATLSITLPESDTQLEVPSILVRADDEGYAFAFKRPRRRATQGAPASSSDARSARRPSTSSVARAHPAPHRRGRSAPPLDVDEVPRIALDALTHVTGHEISSLHLLSAGRRDLCTCAATGAWRPRLREINRVLLTGQGLIGGVAATGKTCTGRTSASPSICPGGAGGRHPGRIHAFVCVPIHSRGPDPGAPSLGRRTPGGVHRIRDRARRGVRQPDRSGSAERAALLATRRQLEDLKSAEAQLIEGEKLRTVGKLAAGPGRTRRATG